MNSQLLKVLFYICMATLLGCQSSPTTDDNSHLSTTPIPAGQANYAWIQYGKSTTAMARAIVTSQAANCPTISVGSATAVPMTVRPIPDSYDNFGAITVCEAELTLPVSTVSVTGVKGPIHLPGVYRASDTALVVGDTGCRLKGGSHQWCVGGSLDRGAWGFPDLSQAAAKNTEPDFILHVGDYLYRETTQPGSDRCDPYDPSRGWVHCGDSWPAWEDDFFRPAQGSSAPGILTLAPWIFVRGNHESCSRAWQGYYLFFYPGQAPNECLAAQDVIAPYSVELSQLDVFVADTSNESSSSAASSFTTIKQALVGTTTPAWLATHVPTADLGSAYASSQLGSQGMLKWIHVGHVHNFQTIAASSAQQTETITGGSGTALDGCGEMPACPVGEATASCCYGEVSSHDAGQYSFLTADYDSANSEWTATLRDIDGYSLYTFTVP